MTTNDNVIKFEELYEIVKSHKMKVLKLLQTSLVSLTTVKEGVNLEKNEDNFHAEDTALEIKSDMCSSLATLIIKKLGEVHKINMLKEITNQWKIN